MLLPLSNLISFNQWSYCEACGVPALSVHSGDRQGGYALGAVPLREAPEQCESGEAGQAVQAGREDAGTQGGKTVVTEEKKCSKCNRRPRVPGNSWCKFCKAEGNRLLRLRKKTFKEVNL